MGYSKAINTKEPMDGLEVAYDNTSSGLTANNVQSVIDELNTNLQQDVNKLSTEKAPMYSYGTEDLESGISAFETGKLYFVHE